MINLTEISNSLFLPKKYASILTLNPGDTVYVKILNKPINGTARISVNGHILSAKISSNYSSGEVFSMKVSFSHKSNTLILTPTFNSKTAIDISQHIFSKLGIPQTEFTSALLFILKSSEISLNGEKIRKIVRTFQHLRDKNKAAFTAALTASKGMAPENKFFGKLFPLIFGNDSDEISSEKSFLKDDSSFHIEAQSVECFDNSQSNSHIDEYEFLTLFNHIRDKGLQWIVVPFEKQINKTTWSGSLSLLLNIEEKLCKLFLLRCKTKNEAWIFSIKDNRCFFKCEIEGYSLLQTEKQVLESLLKTLFEEAGLTSFSVCYTEQDIFTEILPDTVDILV